MSEPDPPAKVSRAETATEVEFAAFYRTTVKPLAAFLILQGATVADAADIAQESMIKAHSAWDRIDHPRAWVFRVASRAWVRRMLNRRENPVAELPEPNPLLRPTDVEGWEQRHAIVHALAALPPRQRQIMAWTLSGYSPAEIAAELDLPPGTVRQNLLLARRALARWLTR